MAAMWRTAAGAAVFAVVTRLLPLYAAGDVTRRMAPVLLFLVAITVLAELAELARLFDVAAVHAPGWPAAARCGCSSSSHCSPP